MGLSVLVDQPKFRKNVLDLGVVAQYLPIWESGAIVDQRPDSHSDEQLRVVGDMKSGLTR